MRIIACAIVAAAVANCASALSPREARETQVRMDVEAILKGMAAAEGMRLEATGPGQRPPPE
jgi:hypothetical protein